MNWPIFAAVFVALLPVVVWRIRHANTVVEAALREAADLDVCESLRAAIRDEQQKGEQA